MKLMTHNLLFCSRNQCKVNSFPLRIKCTEMIIKKDVKFDQDLMIKILKKINFSALTSACKDVSFLLRKLSQKFLILLLICYPLKA